MEGVVCAWEDTMIGLLGGLQRFGSVGFWGGRVRGMVKQSGRKWCWVCK